MAKRKKGAKAHKKVVRRKATKQRKVKAAKQRKVSRAKAAKRRASGRGLSSILLKYVTDWDKPPKPPKRKR
jgi:hypothetical protein